MGDHKMKLYEDIYKNPAPYHKFYRTYGSWFEVVNSKKFIHHYLNRSSDEICWGGSYSEDIPLYDVSHASVSVDMKNGIIEFSKCIWTGSFRKFPLGKEVEVGFAGKFLLYTYKYVVTRRKKIKIKLGSIHMSKPKPSTIHLD